MKRVLLTMACVLIFVIGKGQDIRHARWGSYYTFIFQISNRQAYDLYFNNKQPDSVSYFSRLVKTFPTDSVFRESLPAGHYLFVKTVGGKMKTDLQSVANLDIHILDNQRDLMLVFTDANNRELKGLHPKLKSKSLHYDPKLQAYTLQKTNRQGIVVAEYQGHQNFFELRRKFNNTVSKRVQRRVLGTFPFNHLVSPFFYVKNSIRYGHLNPPGIYYRVKRLFEEKTFQGFIVTNKPKYKPGDTLKLKAYVTRRNGKPFPRKLQLYIRGGDYSERSKKVKTLHPYRPGFYESEMILHDSLKLQLDDRFYVSLEDSKLRHNYPGVSLYFEEYELKQNTFFLNESPLNKVSRPAALVMKGMDSNDLPLYDARAEVFVKIKSIQDFYDSYLFVPDTLWHHKVTLDPLGDTPLLLPDSIYKNAAYEYEVVSLFTNAENDFEQKRLTLSYDAREKEVALSLVRDSLLVTGEEKGTFRLCSYDDKDHFLFETKIKLPYQRKIREEEFSYKLYQDSLQVGQLYLQGQPDQLEAVAVRTSDSLNITVHNPRNILFRYQLFKGNTVVEAGTAQQWKILRKATEQERYYLSLQYLWAGEAKHLDYNFQLAKKTLSISVNHPSSVFPGQETDFTVKVKDVLGRPVKDADITSFAYTRKFKTEPVVKLDQREKIKSRKAFNEFILADMDEPGFEKKLNYYFWKQRLGLDSLQMYHFLYPEKGIYQTAIPVEDSVTQLAPYVVKGGEVQRIFYIYVDQELRYYQPANALQPYSFKISPGSVCHLSLRLSDALVRIPVNPLKNKKLVMAIDWDHLPSDAIVTNMPHFLTASEAEKLAPHFLWVDQLPGPRQAWLEQEKNFFRLYGTSSHQMAGPFFPGPLTFQSNFKINFYFKPGMLYQFEPRLIDRSTYIYSFDQILFNQEVQPLFHDRVLTEKQIRDQWKQEEENRPIHFTKFPGGYPTTRNVGTLTFKNTQVIKAQEIAVFLFNLDRPDDYHIYPGGSRELDKLLPGHYQVAQVFRDGRYVRSPDILIRPFGKTLIDISRQKLLTPDSFSLQTIRKVKQWSTSNAVVEPARQYDMQELQGRYYEQSPMIFTGGRWVSGRVTVAEDGTGIPGVNVVVKGTTYGTVTDANGEYRVYVPYGAVLVTSFIGYVTAEVDVSGTDHKEIALHVDMQQLQEVVVTAMGISSERRSLSSAVSFAEGTLSGRVAGVQSLSVMADSVSIRVRGLSAFNWKATPLVLVDGVPIPFDQIDKGHIGSIEILNAKESLALYGSRAANGIILISTKKGVSRAELLKTPLPPLPEFVSIENSAEGSSIRKNFSDYAFWQPRLRSNAEGKVTFRASFPDDITAWNIYTIGVASKGRQGMIQSSLRSFKPLVAQVTVPRFLIEGDTAWAVGKITNYTREEIQLEKKSTVGHRSASQTVIMKNSFVDSLEMIAAGDSVRVQYEIKHKGYVDGEVRKTPVLRSGAIESVGHFVSLQKDTTITWRFDPSKGKIKLYAQADFLDVMENEMEWLKVYSYECNEQMASKLRAWLAEKMIREFKNEKFEHHKAIEKLIRKLTANQANDGGWSWWGKGNSSLWITLHVVKTLRLAQKLSYKVDIQEARLENYLQSHTSPYLPATQQLETLIFLTEQGLHTVTGAIVDSLRRRGQIKTQFEKLLVQKLLQMTGGQPDWKWIESQKRETLQGNIYWGDPANSLWNNDIDNTLIVYSIFQKENPDHPYLQRMQNFLLEKRKKTWMNTYQSARIIETILPSLLKKQKYEKTTITMNGILVTDFPFAKEMNDSVVSIVKKGSSPVYLGAYQNTWNSAPQPVAGEFVLKTSWRDRDSDGAGKTRTIQIDLDVKKDADYVMISVPIPGGYTYESKPQCYLNGEVHREYDIHETRIYCEHLPAGKYKYELKLISRLKGKYTLNPAKVEWMYFPVIFGRTSMKRVEVR